MIRRLLCQLLGHQFIIPVFGPDGSEVGKYCWRCSERWPSCR